MPKFIAGFLLGLIAALTVVHWFDGDAPGIQTNSANEISVRDDSSDLSQASTSGIDEIATEEDEKAAGSSIGADGGRNESTFSASADSVSNVAPLAAQPQSSAARQPSIGETTPEQSPSGSSGSKDYPPEIADMIANNVDKELQTRYESDEREESWATYMEGQLAGYFAQKPSLSQFYISLIDCRTSVCAVHALGYGPDALTTWNAATADLISQPWFDFNSMSMNRRNPEPDILGIVLIATRKPPE